MNADHKQGCPGRSASHPDRREFLKAAAAVSAAIYQAASSQTIAAEKETKQVLIVVGPSKHPPGTHEVAAGGRVMKYMLEHAEGVPAIAAEVVYKWPDEKNVLDRAATIVLIGDLFPGETLENSAKVKADIARLMGNGCGMVCVHYATGLQAKHVADDGDHPLVGWIGGYFATGCKHHRSVARVCPATLTPETADHPVLRGWKAFSFTDEPYWNNYFGKDGPAKNVTPLVSTMLPPESPKKETVVWAVERADGGRGMGIVVPHFFHNWNIDDLRTLVLNGICWSAKLPIPPQGVKSSLPDLATFKPVSVEPQARKSSEAARKKTGKS
jgi:type 1 glutamine amidotransferase